MNLKTQKAWCLILKLWFAATPLLLAGESMTPFAGSLGQVNSNRDAMHPERAFVSRPTLSANEVAATMPVEINLKMRNFSDLQARVARGETISADEMVSAYEPTAGNYQQVVAWLTSHGFTVTRQDPHHLAVWAEASVGRIQQAMSVSFAKVTANNQE